MADSISEHSFDLPNKSSLYPEARFSEQSSSLLIPFLIRNIEWYCRIRWTIIFFMAGMGIVGLFPENLSGSGFFIIRPDWLLVSAGMLVITNLFFLRHLRKVKRLVSLGEVYRNLWAQIISDLLILTVAVHFMGSLETSAPFMYLFHIVLACVFFSPRQSFMVAVLAAILYVACVTTELMWGLNGGVFANTAIRTQLEQIAVFKVGATLSIWVVVWWFGSRPSAMIREQNSQLSETNRQLASTELHQAKHMLHTTHELKAPFAAIQVNTQLLLKGECGGLPSTAVKIIRRIDQRARWLASEIKDMLQLADLRTENNQSDKMVEVDLPEVIQWCIDQVKSIADERGVDFQVDLKHAHVWAVENQLKILFKNLLTNAIIYSNEGGRVLLKCLPASGGEQLVIIEDQGIGIPQEKLSLIFNEYYRTNEAVKHNKMSSGLGLAIVRQIADTHGIRIRVESRVGAGARFKLWFLPRKLTKERFKRVVE